MNKEFKVDIYDSRIIAINDKIHNFMLQQILELGFVHLYDNKKVALQIVKSKNINGFYLSKDDFKYKYHLLMSIPNLQKGREKALDILSAFMRIFERLGIFLMEFTSAKENIFYLATYINTLYIPFCAKINEDYVSLDINNLFDLCMEKLPMQFNTYSFAYILQNNNRSEMIKKDQELKQLKGYKLIQEDKTKQLKEANDRDLNIILTTSISLIEKGKYRVILDNNLEEIKEVNSDNLVEFLLENNRKTIAKNYKENMKKTIEFFSSNLVENMYICSPCLKKIKRKHIIKTLNQSNHTCSICQNRIGLKYILI